MVAVCRGTEDAGNRWEYSRMCADQTTRYRLVTPGRYAHAFVVAVADAIIIVAAVVELNIDNARSDATLPV